MKEKKSFNRGIQMSILIFGLFLMSASFSDVNGQAAGLTLINTQTCAITVSAGAGPGCGPGACGTVNLVIPAGGTIVAPVCGPATYNWLVVIDPTGPGVVSYNPFIAGCNPPAGAPGTCGGFGGTYTGTWTNAFTVVF